MGIISYLEPGGGSRKKCKLWHFIAARLRGKIFQEFPFNISLNVQKLRTLHGEIKSAHDKRPTFSIPKKRGEFCT